VGLSFFYGQASIIYAIHRDRFISLSFLNPFYNFDFVCVYQPSVRIHVLSTSTEYSVMDTVLFSVKGPGDHSMFAGHCNVAGFFPVSTPG
jgi:hypothetical protein